MHAVSAPRVIKLATRGADGASAPGDQPGARGARTRALEARESLARRRGGAGPRGCPREARRCRHAGRLQSAPAPQAQQAGTRPSRPGTG